MVFGGNGIGNGQGRAILSTQYSVAIRPRKGHCDPSSHCAPNGAGLGGVIGRKGADIQTRPLD